MRKVQIRLLKENKFQRICDLICDKYGKDTARGKNKVLQANGYTYTTVLCRLERALEATIVKSLRTLQGSSRQEIVYNDGIRKCERHGKPMSVIYTIHCLTVYQSVYCCLYNVSLTLEKQYFKYIQLFSLV